MAFAIVFAAFCIAGLWINFCISMDIKKTVNEIKKKVYDDA